MKAKKLNFRNILVEVEFDNFKELDCSKAVGNVVHANTQDIGLDDKAREIYRNGEAELDDRQRAEFLNILMGSNLIAAVKVALKKMLEPDNNNNKK